MDRGGSRLQRVNPNPLQFIGTMNTSITVRLGPRATASVLQLVIFD